jgi:uncharacterized membrane protein YfcA
MVSAHTLMLCFSALLLTVGSVMLRGSGQRLNIAVCHPARCLSAGLGVGLLTGFLGVGGGFVIVPALIFFAGLDATIAVGTSLGIITINSAAGLLGQLSHAEVSWASTLSFALTAVVGMLAGLQLRNRLPERLLPRAFAMLVIVTGLIIGALNVSGL